MRMVRNSAVSSHRNTYTRARVHPDMKQEYQPFNNVPGMRGFLAKKIEIAKGLIPDSTAGDEFVTSSAVGMGYKQLEDVNSAILLSSL